MKISSIKYMFIYGFVCFFGFFSNEILATKLKSVVTIHNQSHWQKWVVGSVKATSTSSSGKMIGTKGFPIGVGSTGKVYLQASGPRIDVRLDLFEGNPSDFPMCVLYVTIDRDNFHTISYIGCGKATDYYAHNPEFTIE
jgi:hypothetical protein